MEPPRTPPELVDDATAEILLRLPPDEPASLVRASLVCKHWRQLLSDPCFLRRYREFHGTPPLIGFLRNIYEEGPHFRFVPTASAFPCPTPAPDCHDWWAVDCRHGRALLHCFPQPGLVVWNPVTGEQQRVPVPGYPKLYHTAAVLCARDGCRHFDCHGGPFDVVFVGTNEDDDAGLTWACVYSSESGTWSDSISIELDSYVEERPSVLNGDALYFSLEEGKRILRYDLVGRALSVIDAPEIYEQPEGIIVTAENGGLGFAGVKDCTLYLWSWQVGSRCIAGWVKSRVINLKTLLPIVDHKGSLEVIGFAEGTDIIFISADAGVFTIMLKSGQVKKICESGAYYAIAPYMSFYTQDLAKTRLPLP